MLVSLVVAALFVSGVAVAGSALRDEKTTKRAQPAPTTAPAPTTTTAPAPTTTTLPPTAIIQPPWASLPPVPGGVVGPGSQGPEVQAYEQRMADIHFDPGPVDGVYDQKTVYAVQTLQKLGGAAPTGRITDADVFALDFFQFKAPMAATPEPNRTEVDITGQTLTLY